MGIGGRMSEVEKMYENAGVKKEVIPCPAKYYGYDCTRNNWDDEDCSCDIEGYPPFTAEKQLSLIKWIAEYKEECRITYEKEYKWCTQIDWQSSFCYDNFPASLANLINSLWQDLTEEEQQQVKGILE